VATDRLTREIVALRTELATYRERLERLEAGLARQSLAPDNSDPTSSDSPHQTVLSPILSAPPALHTVRPSRQQALFQTLWVGPRLSLLEQLSLTSFVQHGHDVRLYVYDEPEGVPEGVVCLDAREVLPEEDIFVYGPETAEAVGSLAGFADLFRFKLLHDRGGWWFDVDVVCLRPIDLDEPFCFGWEQESVVGSSILRAPRESPFALTLYERARSRLSHDQPIAFAEIGPRLLTDVVAQLGLGRYVMPANAFYPVHWKRALDMFVPDDLGALWMRLDGPYAVHFWNETLRWTAIDKNGIYPPTSPFERLKERHGLSARERDRATADDTIGIALPSAAELDVAGNE
jgi:hypothetical protein